MNWSVGRRRIGFVILSLIPHVLILNQAQAQPSEPSVPLPPGAADAIEQTIPQPETPPPPPPPASSPSILPAPELEVAPQEEIPEPTTFWVERVEVLGSTVLQPEIEQLIAQYQKRRLSFNQLIQLRSEITQLYFDNGYITSGAFLLNNQDLSRGVIQIQVVEGELEALEITGLKRLRQQYVRRRLRKATKTPLNRQDLEQALQLLQLDPLLQQVKAELTAGSSPGRSLLRLSLKESRSIDVGLSVDNYRTNSVGSIQGTAELSFNNVSGFGDRFRGRYQRTEGLWLYDLDYTFPINANNGTIGVRFSENNSRIIQDDFQELGIRSDGEVLSFQVRQPVVRTPKNEFALGLDFDLSRNQTFIEENFQFPFSLGTEDGRSKVRALRLSQEWIARRTRSVFVARSQFSLGLDIFNATVNNRGPSGEFLSWLGQVQWVKQLSSAGDLLVTQAGTQLTPDSLLTQERFSLGGANTVRGYIPNQIVADSGVFGSVEYRLPLTRRIGTVQLTPFIDGGVGWNASDPSPSQSSLAAIGIGLRWQKNDVNAKIDFGIPLISAPNTGSVLQNAGLFFSVEYRPSF